MPKLNLQGMSNIRHAIEVLNSRTRRAGLKGAVHGIACGCSRDCGFARFVPSTSPPIPNPIRKYSPRKSRPK